MRTRTTIAIAILVVSFVAGCGGGSPSTEAAMRGAAESEEGGIVAVTTAPRDVQEGEMVAGEEGWVRSEIGVF